MSFADALAWLRYGDVNLPPELKTNPPRPGRLEPRALKHSQNRYPYMKLPRDVLKGTTPRQAIGIRLSFVALCSDPFMQAHKKSPRLIYVHVHASVLPWMPRTQIRGQEPFPKKRFLLSPFYSSLEWSKDSRPLRMV